MFNELVESCVAKKSTNKSWAVIASGATQFIALSLLMLAPLIYTQALPTTMLNSFLLAPAPPASRPVVAAKATSPLPNKRYKIDGVIRAPRLIPATIPIIAYAGAVAVDLPSDQQNPIFEGIPGGDSTRIARAPVAPLPPSTTIARIKQGGEVQQAMLISQVKPTYPALGLQIHLQGDVVLHAIIDTQGRVSELQVISGHPLLIQAALDAVRRWRYRPTMLNGEPVEVDTTITASFRIGG